MHKTYDSHAIVAITNYGRQCCAQVCSNKSRHVARTISLDIRQGGCNAVQKVAYFGVLLREMYIHSYQKELLTKPSATTMQPQYHNTSKPSSFIVQQQVCSVYLGLVPQNATDADTENTQYNAEDIAAEPGTALKSAEYIERWRCFFARAQERETLILQILTLGLPHGAYTCICAP